jgi:hypothetical protein
LIRRVRMIPLPCLDQIDAEKAGLQS